MHEKMEAILNQLEEDVSPLQNSEIYAKVKVTITKAVEELCESYRSLAEKYERVKCVAMDVQSSESSPASDNRNMKNMEVLGARDVSQLEAIVFYPESTVEDADIECEATMIDLEHNQRVENNLEHKDGGGIKPKFAWSDGVNYKFSKLVEENTQLQIELIRRNSEKRETIRKLQDQVSRLRVENDTLQRTLSYLDRNQQNLQVNSPRRKAILLEKLFKGCSP